uniref:Tudor domain-containing protein 5 n=1 Tax=Strigops habroptila TaxID=2489341 RepID=A0A672TXX6_STRHB
MSKKGQLMEVLKKEVRSLLMAAKEGLTPAQLEHEYMAMIGRPLPVRDLGYQSTLELVADMPEVVRICPYEKGTFILKAIADETTKAIAKLVARQRRSAKERKGAAVRADAISPRKNPQSFPWRGKAAILPAAVKAEVQDLLSSSPLLLLDFHNAFFRRFGRAFEYTQYGFFSMFEVLRSVSDIVVVEQTKAGSLLTLKKHLASEIKKEEMPQGEVSEGMLQGEAWEKMPRGGTQEEMPQSEGWEEMPRGSELPDLIGRICLCPLYFFPLGIFKPSFFWEKSSYFQKENNERKGNNESYFVSQAHLMAVCTCTVGAHRSGKGHRSSSYFGVLCTNELGNKLIMTPEIPPDAVQDRSLCSLPPLERRCLVGVFVEIIVSPSQFYVHICSRETSDKLQDMMVEMRHCYSNKLVSDRYIMPESSVQPGQLCCVTISKWWYRVIIHRVINDKDVEVFYPDYGNLEIVRKSWLRFLKWCFLKLPAQAIPCSLAWVKPMEDTWSNAATLLFKNLCSSKLLVGIVDEYVNGVLHLFLCDTSTKEDVYFHCVLKDKGYADICGENIPSEVRREACAAERHPTKQKRQLGACNGKIFSLKQLLHYPLLILASLVSHKLRPLIHPNNQSEHCYTVAGAVE